MTMTPEERRLIHQKGQQPTYGSGSPNPNDGKNGDIYFGKVGDEVVQYVKQDGKWVQVSSVSASETGIGVQFGDQFISDAHEFFEILNKFKSTIKYWGASWSWSGMFTVNYAGDSGSGQGFGEGTLVQFLQIPGNLDSIADNQLTFPGRAFIVPRSCKLVNINFLMLVPQVNDSESTYGFNLYLFESDPVNDPGQEQANALNFDYMDFAGANNGAGTLEFTVTVAPGGTFGQTNVPVGALMTIDRGYGIGVEQTGFPGDPPQNAQKGSLWTAFFQSTG